MKKLIAFSIVVLVVSLPGVISPILGQWQKHVIDDNVSLACSVDTADLNGDGKLDLVVTDHKNNSIYWYQNNDTSWIKHTIDASANKVTFAFCGDIDGDDTIDVVACIWGQDKMVWYENNHPTWTQHMIDESTDGADFFQVADINGDDRPDVVTGGKILAWYENPTWTKHIIDPSTTDVPAVRVNDIDGDKIQDVVATRVEDNKVVWYKTEDKGITWTKQIIDDNLINAFGFNSGDIDGDGNLDIAVTTGGPYYAGSDVIWYENHHPIWTKHVVDTDLPGATVAYVTDVDGDGTMDIIATGYNMKDVVWYKNNHPTWIKFIIDDNLAGPRTGLVIDLDGNKTNDIILPGYSNVVWYENLSEIIDDVASNIPTGFELYQCSPNPFNHSTSISYSIANSGVVSLKVYDLFGREIQTLVHESQNAGIHSVDFDARKLSDGIFLYRLQVGNDFVKTKKMLYSK